MKPGLAPLEIIGRLGRGPRPNEANGGIARLFFERRVKRVNDSANRSIITVESSRKDMGSLGLNNRGRFRRGVSAWAI